uniref:Uncharacterized protein n=1 Tax=Chromera velia CCMP2878 TaxID=1169474 RepID=A0A0G4HT23_9ALVE|eukprot:Cvel_31230.t1-p1 / transcript=Cvel_31230.t1 / gene=Cvel_31230 / organism=Chromera_velia_CCMP2878 / gene_product=hypothetical protein / transcript_product=hypothetical protein / location=Cvel_scaffold4616:3707-5429(-) / protein_length=414 / sequence_SO=supercontig / SO=protein_coding / is_pseudo=false
MGVCKRPPYLGSTLLFGGIVGIYFALYIFGENVQTSGTCTYASEDPTSCSMWEGEDKSVLQYLLVNTSTNGLGPHNDTSNAGSTPTYKYVESIKNFYDCNTDTTDPGWWMWSNKNSPPAFVHGDVRAQEYCVQAGCKPSECLAVQSKCDGSKGTLKMFDSMECFTPPVADAISDAEFACACIAGIFGILLVLAGIFLSDNSTRVSPVERADQGGSSGQNRTRGDKKQSEKGNKNTKEPEDRKANPKDDRPPLPGEPEGGYDEEGRPQKGGGEGKGADREEAVETEEHRVVQEEEVHNQEAQGAEGQQEDLEKGEEEGEGEGGEEKEETPEECQPENKHREALIVSQEKNEAIDVEEVGVSLTPSSKKTDKTRKSILPMSLEKAKDEDAADITQRLVPIAPQTESPHADVETGLL